MPKTIRWIIFSALLLFVLLSAYRYCIYLVFHDIFSGAKADTARAFWYGLRFDGRIVGIATLLMFLFSFYPGKHYFRSEEGRKLALWLFGFFITLILVFYIADIAYLRNFDQRLHGSIISDLAKNTDKGRVYKSKTEWFAITAIMVATIVIYVFVMNKIHGVISNMKGTANSGKRITWQLILILFCLVSIYGNIALRPLTVSSASSQLNEPALKLASDPFDAFFSTLPGRK